MIYIEKLIQSLESARPDKPVLCHRDREMTAASFLNLIAGFVQRLSGRGIARQQLIGLLAPNRPEALAARYAAHLLGAATSYITCLPSRDANRDLIRDLDPDLVLAFPETLHMLPSEPEYPTVIVGKGGPRRSRIHKGHLNSFAKENDLAVVISSGGSTGLPKGSCRDFNSYTQAVSAHSDGARRQLINGPMANLSQILVDVTLMNGGYVVLRDAFDAADTLLQIDKRKITDLFLVEPQLFELMDHADVPSTDLSSLRRLVHVGASAPDVLRKRASDNLGPCLMHTYGASEMGIVSCLSTTHYRDDFTSAGYLMDGVAIRFRDRNGNLAERCMPGIIEINAPGMAQGYRMQSDLTAKAFEGGWYRSGDLGYMDEGERLHILGRASEIEWIEEDWVTPTALENALCELPFVRYAVVLVDLALKRRVVAIEAAPEFDLDVVTCLHMLEKHFSTQIANTFEFLSYVRIPRTAQGKPDRARIWSDADDRFALQAAPAI